MTEIKDDEGFPCDDMESIESWMKECLSDIIKAGRFYIKALISPPMEPRLMYLDAHGDRLTPVYNYLKPMPDDVLDGFYESYGGNGRILPENSISGPGNA